MSLRALHPRPRAAAAAGLIGLLLAAPPAAFAGDDDRRWRGGHAARDHRDDRDDRRSWDRREHHRRDHGRVDRRAHAHRSDPGWRHHDRKKQTRQREDHRWHRHRVPPRPPSVWSAPGRYVDARHRHYDDWRWKRYRRPVVIHSPYYCAPCSHWYGDRRGFDAHVYGYHRLPRRHFADAVSELVWGVVYFGL